MVESEEKQRLGWAPLIAVTIVIIMLEIPYIPKLLGGNPALIPFMLLFWAGTFFRRISIKRRNLAFSICVIVYFSVSFLYKIVGISTAGIGNYINPIAYFFCFSVMNKSIDNMSRTQKLFLFWTIILTVCFTMASNWILYNRYGNVYFRISQYVDTLTNNVNTQYTVAVMLLSGISLICFLHTRNNKLLWIVIFIITNLFNFFVTQRGIVLLLSVAMFALIIVFNRKRQSASMVLLLVVGIFLILAIFYFDAMIEIVGRFIHSDRLMMRLYQISRALSAGDINEGGGSLSARFRLYMQSIETWLRSTSNFLFGVGDHKATNTVIGNHSQLTDLLGQYGLFVALATYYAVYRTLKEALRKLRLEKRSPIYFQVVIVYLIFAVRGVLGYVLFGTIGVQLFLMLPIAISLLKDEGVISE